MIRLAQRIPGECVILAYSYNTKPEPRVGSCFVELDTQDIYLGNGVAWVLLSKSVLPIGAVILTDSNSDPPINFGTWTLVGRTNFVILGSPPSNYQPYVWRRTA